MLPELIWTQRVAHIYNRAQLGFWDGRILRSGEKKVCHRMSFVSVSLVFMADISKHPVGDFFLGLLLFVFQNVISERSM